MTFTIALSQRSLGLVWIAVSAIGFGSMAIFAKLAYADGVAPLTLLFLRFSIAATALVAVMWARGRRWPRGRNLLILVLMGSVGYVGQSYCYFESLRHATAGVTALLLYLYPALVTLLGWWFFKRRMSVTRVSALLMAFAGCAMTVAGALHSTALGITLGITAALIYAIYVLAGERVTSEEGALPSATVVVLSAAFVYSVLWLAEGAELPSSLRGWSGAVGIALFSTVVAVLGFLAGLRRLGAADASTVSTLEPVVTIALAAAFLQETLAPIQLVGGAVILAAVIMIAREKAPGVAPQSVGDGRK